MFKKFFLVAVVLVILGVVGWVMNIVKLTQCDFAEPYKCEVVRSVGVIVPPVGAVTGWVDLGK